MMRNRGVLSRFGNCTKDPKYINKKSLKDIINFYFCRYAPIFRIVIPDEKYKWPEDSEEYPYNMQLESPYGKE